MAIKVLAEDLIKTFESSRLNESICRSLTVGGQLAVQSVAYDSFASLKTFDMSKYSFEGFFVNKALRVLDSFKCFSEDKSVEKFIKLIFLGITSDIESIYEGKTDIYEAKLEIGFDNPKAVALYRDELMSNCLEDPECLQSFVKKLNRFSNDQLEKLEFLFYQRQDQVISWYESLKIEGIFLKCFKDINLEPLNQEQQQGLVNFFREFISQISETIDNLSTSKDI